MRDDLIPACGNLDCKCCARAAPGTTDTSKTIGTKYPHFGKDSTLPKSDGFDFEDMIKALDVIGRLPDNERLVVLDRFVAGLKRGLSGK